MGLIPQGNHLFFAFAAVAAVFPTGAVGGDLASHPFVQVNFDCDTAVFFAVGLVMGSVTVAHCALCHLMC